MDIRNKTGFELPEYILATLRRVCIKAQIPLDMVTLIVKRRNRYKSTRWIKKGDTNMVSGTYKMDRRTIIIRIGRKSSEQDVMFVIAHEMGHLKQHREAHLNVHLTEGYAHSFALLECNCYPASRYRISKVKLP